MSWFSRALKTVGNFVGDNVKAAVYTVVAPVNSITGHKYQPGYQTGAGNVIGKLGETAINSTNVLAKGFADGISGGLATKAVNVIRKDENKEKAFSGYVELKQQAGHASGVKPLDSLTGGITKLSVGVGKTIGEIYGKGGGSGPSTQTSIIQQLLPPQAPQSAINTLVGQQEQQRSSETTVLLVAAAVVGLILLTKKR